MITNNNLLGTTSLQDGENLKALSDTLYELTKYDNDLRVFFETCITYNPIIKNDCENLNDIFSSEQNKNTNSSQSNKDENTDHNDQIGNQKLNHSTETKLTADLIYEFLQNDQIKSSISNTANGAEQFLPTPKNNSIQLDISKLSNELQQIVNCLLGIEAPQLGINELFSLFSNNNNKSNTNGQNQNDKSSQLDFDFTKRNSSNELQNSNSQQKSDNTQVNTEEQSTKELVSLTTDQFKDLIYYLIVLAVAKNEGMDIYAKESNVNYNDVKNGIEEDFKSKNTNGIFTKLDDYRQKVENQTLREHIYAKSREQEDQTSFWFPLLLSYLGRASFLYGLYNAIISEDNRKKNVIDVALASPNILFALSLLFGFGAAANLILGFITLVSLLYKFIDQYPKERKKYLIYKLVRSELFRSKLGELSNILTPQVGNLYKLHQALVNEDNKKHLKEEDERFASLNKQYGNVPFSTQEETENIDLDNLKNPYD